MAAVENTTPQNTAGAQDCFVVNMFLKCLLACKGIIVFCSSAVKFKYSGDFCQTAEVIELLKLYPLRSWLFSQLIGSEGGGEGTRDDTCD